MEKCIFFGLKKKKKNMIKKSVGSMGHNVTNILSECFFKFM